MPPTITDMLMQLYNNTQGAFARADARNFQGSENALERSLREDMAGEARRFQSLENIKGRQFTQTENRLGREDALARQKAGFTHSENLQEDSIAGALARQKADIRARKDAAEVRRKHELDLEIRAIKRAKTKTKARRDWDIELAKERFRQHEELAVRLAGETDAALENRYQRGETTAARRAAEAITALDARAENTLAKQLAITKQQGSDALEREKLRLKARDGGLLGGAGDVDPRALQRAAFARRFTPSQVRGMSPEEIVAVAQTPEPPPPDALAELIAGKSGPSGINRRRLLRAMAKDMAGFKTTPFSNPRLNFPFQAFKELPRAEKKRYAPLLPNVGRPFPVRRKESLRGLQEFTGFGGAMIY